jgi:hypothetical protein
MQFKEVIPIYTEIHTKRIKVKMKSRWLLKQMVPIVQESGWAPEPVWTQRLDEKSFAPPGIEPRSPGRQARSQTLYWVS